MKGSSPIPPVLQILSGSHKGRQIRLLSPRITLGRGSGCDVIFKNPSVSEHHARLKKKESFYFIESLDPKNPARVNEKPVSSHLLKSKDKLRIGNIEMQFLDHLPPRPSLPRAAAAKKNSWLSPPRLVLILVLAAGAFLFLSGGETEKKENKGLRTEADILKEVKELEALNEEKTQEESLSPPQKAARAVFIKGFRDYRKGYFSRALKLFERCLTLEKASPLCLSYVQKSKMHIDKLIQKKIRLGKAYKANKQYEACRDAFESVETMLKDSSSAVFKEVRESKRLCEIQLKNKI